MGKKPPILHPKCGQRFVDSSRTGHCGECCRTFYGTAAFDNHLSRDEDGKYVHADPATDKREWHLDEQDRWHFGPRLTKEQKEQIWKRSPTSELSTTAPLTAP